MMTKLQLQKFSDRMTPQLQKLWLRFHGEMFYAGLDYAITSVARDYKQQVALFAQGRQNLAAVNAYRKIAGLYPLKTQKQNKIVTWTMKSYHVTNLDDQDPFNDKSRAFDIALIGKDKKAHWDLKVSVNKNQIPDFVEAAEIGKSVGLTCGAYFKKPDYPHYQVG